jgi:hypothetical protein
MAALAQIESATAKTRAMRVIDSSNPYRDLYDENRRAIVRPAEEHGQIARK